MHAVFRMHQKHLVDFTPGRPMWSRATWQGPLRPAAFNLVHQLVKHDQLVHWLSPLAGSPYGRGAFAHLPDRLDVRELPYQVHRKGFRVTNVTLVITLLDATRYPVEALAQLPYTRWGIETNFAHVKTTRPRCLEGKTVTGSSKDHRLRLDLQRGPPGDGPAARRQQVTSTASALSMLPDGWQRCDTMSPFIAVYPTALSEQPLSKTPQQYPL